MAKSQKIKQAKWLKGVNAAASDFAQPPGSFPRVSNLVYIVRGSLKTCDGTQLISAFNGAPQPPSANLGPITELFLYEPIGLQNNYFAIAKDYNTNIAFPTGLMAADAGGGGNLSAGTYIWVVTALDGAGGETTQSSQASLVLAANHKANLTWTAVNLATGYNVYRTIANGGVVLFVATVNTNSYQDNIADANLGSTHPPSINSTQVSQFYLIPSNSYSAANIVKTFPADLIPVIDGTGGGFGGGGAGPAHSPQVPPTPAGGSLGNISPLPQIVQFKNLMVLILGNGIVPYTSDGTTPNTIPIVNNFQASYGARTASTPQNVGDQISANVGGTNYIFTVSQAGTTSAGGPPAFSANEGAIVVDGTVYWKNSGKVAVSTPPRGAAHGIVYAGSLWVLNTSPTSTTDNFDGPSCLKMSDLNNPNSWNPLNVAFLDRDDGTQGTGLATFTIAESGIPPVGSLVAFKDFSTFQINGVFGASNFSIQRAQTDMGCVAPRTIQFVPGFGIVRLTHLGIAVFDGVRDRLLSEEIRPYIFGGQPDIHPVDWNFVWFSKAAQTASPPMYCCAVPLRNVIGSTSSMTFSGSVQLIGGQGLTAGTYFIVVQGISADGNTITNLSGELSFTTFGIHQAIQLVLPSNAGFATWKIFLGNNGAGSENLYFTVPGSQLNVQIDGTTVLFPGLTTTDIGQMKRIFCYDLVLKSWTIIDLPFAISVLKQFRSMGTIPITTMAGFSDGAIRRWQAGDTDWDTGAVNGGAPDATVHFSVRSPEVFGKDASDRVYFRQLEIRGKGSLNNLPAPLTIPTVISEPGFGGGTLPGNVLYFVKFAWINSAGTIFAASPGAANFLTATGALSVTPSGSPPVGATGYAVYIGSGTSGNERLQATIVGFGGYQQTVPLVQGLLFNSSAGIGNLFVKVTVNGVAGSNLTTQNVTVLPMGGNEFIAYADIGLTGIDAYADISAAGPLEIDSLDWLAIAKAVRGRVTV